MIAVIGGGIVGLATAYALRDLGPVVFEKESEVAVHQSGRNSGVLHSALHFRPGSQKARLCTEGARLMTEFCGEHAIPHRRCGQVVVAADPGEMARMERLYEQGRANGVAVERIGPERLREIEPHARGLAALHVPQAGLVDYAAVTRKLAGFIEVRRGVRVTSVRALRARLVINCAGLHSDRLAAPSRLRIVPFRGEYHRLKREWLVRGLIYQVPDPVLPFKGVHLTRMITGGARVGPNAVLALKREGYGRGEFSLRDTLETVLYPGFWRMARRHWRTGLEEIWRSWSRRAFLRSIQHLIPEMRVDDLEPGIPGIRAQAMDPGGTLVDDFHIEKRDGAIHVLNAPSPAATASLAIGRFIANIARREYLGTPPAPGS